jgi:hypothetical protein
LGLLFLDFSTIFNRFYKSQLKHIKGIESFSTRVPGHFLNLHNHALSLPFPGTDGDGEHRRRGEARQANKRGKTAIGLTRGRWVAEG